MKPSFDGLVLACSGLAGPLIQLLSPLALGGQLYSAHPSIFLLGVYPSFPVYRAWAGLFGVCQIPELLGRVRVVRASAVDIA